MDRFGSDDFRGGKQTKDSSNRDCFIPRVDASGANDEYELVPASTAAQPLGPTGGIGDYISHVVIVPAAAAAGAVSIKDGAGGAVMTIFAGGGTVALPTLAPISVFLGMRATAAEGWLLTTGANVSAIAVGDFT